MGGTTEDKTESISPYYTQLVIEIAESLNLKLSGIDIIASDITNSKNTDYSILEVYSAPDLDNYVYEGQQQEDYVKKYIVWFLTFLKRCN